MSVAGGLMRDWSLMKLLPALNRFLLRMCLFLAAALFPAQLPPVRRDLM
jgi:hypothetical protein